jgi:hypothetical protein
MDNVLFNKEILRNDMYLLVFHNYVFWYIHSSHKVIALFERDNKHIYQLWKQVGNYRSLTEGSI